ncbi:GNAT family N-acetyltransferase [Lysobacter korlensis]|uniref:GNAT family N-acetyltransferase n=1 Tax=Lysobacter korlensis TaxID=553636 RepID=A0ABV6RY82_9GAMM
MIRSYRPTDHGDVYDVCVRTGNAGGDARGRYVTDDLLGDLWAGPYLELEPGLAFVVAVPLPEGGERVAGYILGTADTRGFVERYRREWLPRLTAKYTEDEDTWAGFHPERMLIPAIDEFPAHLHIDLLPELQRQGWGRMLMRRFLAAAADRGAGGAHLSFDPANTGAAAFYDRLGFQPLPSSRPDAPLYGIRIPVG